MRLPRRRGGHALVVAVVGGLLAAGCVTPTPSPTPEATPPAPSSPGASATATAAPTPGPTSTPTPPPTSPAALALELVAGGFERPLAIVQPRDGSGRLFVVEQTGLIRIVNPDSSVAPQPFLNLRAEVLYGGERGLLGLAFHPRYPTNGRFFVDYTRRVDGATVIAEYRVSSDPGIADQATERILMVIPQPFANHNGGALVFGPEGYLYIGMGDGGSQGDPLGNAQNPGRLLGKVLRLDVTSPPPGGAPYAIPPGNPFASGGGAPEVWTVGMRNPWRMSFDREGGDLYIADVGAGSWEEIDRQAAQAEGGLNYGWPIMEGRHCTSGSCSTTGLVQPIAEYGHDQGCAVVGGYVYRGAAQPALWGNYVFADYCSGLVFTLLPDEAPPTPRVVLGSGLAVSSFGEDEAGELYLVDVNGGGLYRVVVAN